MVVLDNQDYLDKAQDLLAEKDIYRAITGIPLPGTKILIELLEQLNHKVD